MRGPSKARTRPLCRASHGSRVPWEARGVSTEFGRPGTANGWHGRLACATHEGRPCHHAPRPASPLPCPPPTDPSLLSLPCPSSLQSGWPATGPLRALAAGQLRARQRTDRKWPAVGHQLQAPLRPDRGGRPCLACVPLRLYRCRLTAAAPVAAVPCTFAVVLLWYRR